LEEGPKYGDADPLFFPGRGRIRRIKRYSPRESRLKPEFQEFVTSSSNLSSQFPSQLPNPNPPNPPIPLYGYKVGFYLLTRIQKLSILKDPIPPMERSGIYQLKSNCGAQYVGQSGRALQKKLGRTQTGLQSVTKFKFIFGLPLPLFL